MILKSYIFEAISLHKRNVQPSISVTYRIYLSVNWQSIELSMIKRNAIHHLHWHTNCHTKFQCWCCCEHYHCQHNQHHQQHPKKVTKDTINTTTTTPQTTEPPAPHNREQNHNHQHHHCHQHHQQHHQFAIRNFCYLMPQCGFISPAVLSQKILTSDKINEFIDNVERQREGDVRNFVWI